MNPSTIVEWMSTTLDVAVSDKLRDGSRPICVVTAADLCQRPVSRPAALTILASAAHAIMQRYRCKNAEVQTG
jgi:hypothetical protein